MKVKHLKSEEQKEKKKKNEQNLKELWDTIKQINTCITGILDGQKRGRKYI